MKPVRTTVCAMLCSAALMVSASAAWANTSPTGHPGQPGAPGTTCGSSDANATPGNSANPNTQSPFNPAGNAGQRYNPGSQYDIACYQQFQHGHL